jgi:hypothetical protein
MKRLLMAISILLVLAAVPALAQNPLRTQLKASPGEVAATPEMWFYQQYMQQYQDPKMAVRRNAEVRADQRLRRLEAMRWFGLSNARPRAHVDPINDDYSPGWASNHTWYPDRWTAIGRPWVAVQTDGSRMR